MAKEGTKYITEIFKAINDDPTLFQTTYKKVGNGGLFSVLFKHAFTAEGKFLLPDGVPPFKPNANPIGMTPAIFQQEINKFYVFCRRDISANKRETMYIQLLESIHPEEAKILNAIKDQTLTSLYPNITKLAVSDAGFIPPLTPEERAKEELVVKKSSGKRPGRPKKAVSEPASPK